MFTRYSKRAYLLFLITSACGVFPCRSSPAAVIEVDFNLPIPSPDDPCSKFSRGRMEDAIINVKEHILIDDLDVAVSLTHGAFMDLEIVLESPAGTVIMLNPSVNTAFWIKGPGGGHSAGGANRFLFDDEAAVGIDEATPPFDRAFRPVPDFKLSDFDGEDAFGLWRLQIQDVLFDNIGHLEKVELIISTPEPATTLLFGLGAVIVFSLRRRCNRIGIVGSDAACAGHRI